MGLEPKIRRYGSRPALVLRVAFTMLVVCPALWLAWRIVVISGSGNPRPAALAWLMIGVLIFGSVPLLRWVWRPTSAWTDEQMTLFRAQQRIADHHRRLLRVEAIREQMDGTTSGTKQ
jgi:type VI protein secretion system component VasK